MIFDLDQPISKDGMELHLLNEKLADDLIHISSDPRIWKYMPEPLYKPQVFKEQWIDKAIKQIAHSKRICFVIFFKQRIAGSSSYYEIDLANKKLNIGYTWFHPDFWGSKANPLAKFIMLEYVFENLGYNRVGFSVDSINLPSCNALNKLGIKQEGILRNHLVLSDGRIRNSVTYSVIPQEWPDIKRNIELIVKTD